MARATKKVVKLEDLPAVGQELGLPEAPATTPETSQAVEGTAAPTQINTASERYRFDLEVLKAQARGEMLDICPTEEGLCRCESRTKEPKRDIGPGCYKQWGQNAVTLVSRKRRQLVAELVLGDTFQTARDAARDYYRGGVTAQFGEKNEYLNEFLQALIANDERFSPEEIGAAETKVIDALATVFLDVISYETRQDLLRADLDKKVRVYLDERFPLGTFIKVDDLKHEFSRLWAEWKLKLPEGKAIQLMREITFQVIQDRKPLVAQLREKERADRQKGFGELIANQVKQPRGGGSGRRFVAGAGENANTGLGKNKK